MDRTARWPRSPRRGHPNRSCPVPEKVPQSTNVPSQWSVLADRSYPRQPITPAPDHSAAPRQARPRPSEILFTHSAALAARGFLHWRLSYASARNPSQNRSLPQRDWTAGAGRLLPLLFGARVAVISAIHSLEIAPRKRPTVHSKHVRTKLQHDDRSVEVIKGQSSIVASSWCW